MYTVQRCWRKWFYSYFQAIQPLVARDYFVVGTAVHRTIRAFFDGNPPEIGALTYRTKEGETLNVDGDEWAATWMTAWAESSAHAELDLCSGEAVCMERALQAELPCGVALAGTIDLLLEMPDGMRVVVDSKSTDNLPQAEPWMHADLQGSLYALLAVVNELMPRDQITFAYHYVLREVPPLPKRLKSGKFSTDQRTRTDQLRFLEALRAEGTDPAEYKEFIAGLPVQRMMRVISSHRFPSQLDDALFTADNLAQMLMGRWDALLEIGCEPRANVPAPNGIAERSVRRECNWDCPYRALCFVELEGGDSTEIRTGFHVAEPRYDVEEQEPAAE